MQYQYVGDSPGLFTKIYQYFSMDKRDSILNAVLIKIQCTDNLLLELATGVGKSRMALECAKKIGGTWLIVVDQTTHARNWQDEIMKWNFDSSKIRQW